ncbi:hypothetical protein FNW52_09210 [Flavobacterium sp. ZT3R18]|uniref:DUF5991 domain-containing protein n=1 Tax=Flavobacterium sp. ZT3R18 TaxID=2594429 RepID=UPI00117B83AE|nr:DUF5991 domain-containing protein [Flavobacterium sp. ZT3R18]TRX36193.1 hypothetical protein FNW52_09210 [Flavobacterium sp. ZT3R18]
MKKSKLTFLILLLIIVFGCKNDNKKNELSNQINKNSASKEFLNNQPNDTLVLLDNNIVVFFEPNTKEIKELKKKHGDDDFYIIADDVAGYIANITEQLDLKKIKYITTDKMVVTFKKSGLSINKNKLESKWSILYFNKNGKIKIVAPINFNESDLNINNNIKYDKWYGKYDYTVNYGKIDDLSGAVVGYNISITKDSITFSGSGYQTDFYYLCNTEINKDTLTLKYNKTIEGNPFKGDLKLPLLKMYSKNGDFFIKSELVYSNENGKQINNNYVKALKR